MKTIRFTSVLIFFSSAAFAQQDSIKAQSQRALQKDLEISEQKAVNLQNALRLNQAVIEQLLKDRDLPAKGRQKQINVLIHQRETAVKSILSKDEYKKFEEIVSARMQAKRNQTAATLEQLRQQDQEQLKKNRAENKKQ